MADADATSDRAMARIYEPWVEKHKPPRGFGSRCPPMDQSRTALMLSQAVADPNSNREPPTLYYAQGEAAFAAHEHAPGRYHGYPVPGREVPPAALRELRERGHITDVEFKRLLKQAALPDSG